MGVNTKIRLPHDVQVGDVARVAGILAGLPYEMYDYIEYGKVKCRWVKVPLASVTTCNGTPTMCNVVLNAPTIDGEDSHHSYYHFEDTDVRSSREGRLFSPSSTPFWIAVGVGLAKFFGGTVDFNDCDEVRTNVSFPKPRRKNNPQDGKEWTKYQREMFAVRPLELRDLRRYQKKAGYAVAIPEEKKEEK